MTHQQWVAAQRDREQTQLIRRIEAQDPAVWVIDQATLDTDGSRLAGAGEWWYALAHEAPDYRFHLVLVCGGQYVRI